MRRELIFTWLLVIAIVEFQSVQLVFKRLYTQPDQTLFLFKSIWNGAQGSKGCKKSEFFLQIKLLSFCAKIAPKRYKLRKIIKIERKCQKTCFLRVFQIFFNLGAILA